MKWPDQGEHAPQYSEGTCENTFHEEWMKNPGYSLGKEKVLGFHNTFHQFCRGCKVTEDENPTVRPQRQDHEHYEWKLQGATLYRHKELYVV